MTDEKAAAALLRKLVADFTLACDVVIAQRDRQGRPAIGPNKYRAESCAASELLERLLAKEGL